VQRTRPSKAPCLCRHGRMLAPGAACAWQRPGRAQGGLRSVPSRRRTHVGLPRRIQAPSACESPLHPTLWAPGGAQVVAFLCSDKAAFVNGVALPIDGGFHLGKV